MPQRIAYIDTAKGICIILVVAYHCNLHYNEATDNMLGCIRMPLYYFLSGLFFKLYDGYGTFVKKKVNRLLIPFLFFYLIMSVVLPNLFHGLAGYQINTVVGWRSLYAFIWPEKFPNIPIWFLWSLFLANVIFYPILLLLKKSVSWLALLVMAISVTGYALRYYDLNLPAFVDDTMFFLPFFFLGYVCHSFGFLSISIGRLVCVLLSVLLFCLTYWLSNVVVSFFVADMFSFYAACLSGIVAVLLLSRSVGSLPVITYYGRYSIMLLVTHCLVLQAIQMGIVRIGLTDVLTHVLTFLLTLLSYQLLIPLMRRYLPYFTAQKDLIS